MKLWLYRILYWITNLVLPVFFSDIVIQGKKNIPEKGSCIIAANHPNEFLDILLIGVTCGHPVGFWAKSTLFKGFTGWWVRSLGALPVRRKMDESDSSKNSKNHVDNSELEKQTFQAFQQGRVMCVFPEGTSHSEAHLLQIKDGVSWTVFDYFDANDGKHAVPIIPCGINYISKDRWRSQVVIHYGKPIIINKERLDAFRKDKKKAVKTLTKELEVILKSLTINAPDWETMKLLKTTRRIYMSDTNMSLAEYVQVNQKFCDVYTMLENDSKVQELRKDIKEYQDSLDRLHLRDSDVRGITIKPSTLLEFLDRVFFMTIMFPLGFLGFIVNGPIILGIKSIRDLTPYQESKATHSIFALLFLVPTVYTAYSFLLSYSLGLRFILCFTLLVVFGACHVRILEEEVNGIKSFLFAFRKFYSVLSRTRREEFKKLKQMREDLETRITQLVNEQKVKSPYLGLFDLHDIERCRNFTKRLIPEIGRTTSFSDLHL